MNIEYPRARASYPPSGDSSTRKIISFAFPTVVHPIFRVLCLHFTTNEHGSFYVQHRARGLIDLEFLISAGIFASFHFYSPGEATALGHVIGTFFLGLFFNYLYEMLEYSIYSPWISHTVWDVVAFSIIS
ncbi:MAG: CPBP family intramembrane metalloprotease [Thermotogae bacterium]|nr:CPBP family intramembrane metalloprotease [Thermotogota bacterium]